MSGFRQLHPTYEWYFYFGEGIVLQTQFRLYCVLISLIEAQPMATGMISFCYERAGEAIA